MSELPTSPASPLDQALQALRSGKLVIVVDAQERENEGDLICAAESVTPEMVNFMLRQGAGVLCAPLAHDIAERSNRNRTRPRIRRRSSSRSIIATAGPESARRRGP
jgi:3,4-dihydroxy-2-butanone 4-phosphate synthase